jgi:hypothetical protein
VLHGALPPLPLLIGSFLGHRSGLRTGSVVPIMVPSPCFCPSHERRPRPAPFGSPEQLQEKRAVEAVTVPREEMMVPPPFWLNQPL